MLNLANQLFVIEKKNVVNRFIEVIFEEEHDYCKKEDILIKILCLWRRRFQSSNKCWICNKLFTEEDKKVRDHDHITGKYWRSVHSNCNINLRLTEKVPVIFHYLTGYDIHLIMQEIDKIGAEINVIPNELEKYMTFL